MVCNPRNVKYNLAKNRDRDQRFITSNVETGLVLSRLEEGIFRANGVQVEVLRHCIEGLESENRGGFRKMVAQGLAQPTDELHAALGGAARLQHQRVHRGFLPDTFLSES